MRETGIPWRSATRFLLVGAGGTAAYVALYLGVRASLPPQAANVTARTVVAVLTTGTAFRVAFGVRPSWSRVVVTALGLLVVSSALSAVSLEVLAVADPRAGRCAELAVLIAVTIVVTGLRFAALRAVSATVAAAQDRTGRVAH